MAAARTVTVFAPAKINLTLHVTGQRDDGYHVLDSLVVFADVGDRVEVRASDSLDLTVEGPEAAEVPVDASNLVLKVAQLFDDLPGAAIRLAKELPVASGIGGGSSDAAASVRALSCLLDGQRSARTDMQDALLPLGADIPVCLSPRPARMRGIGEAIEPIVLPPLEAAVLVNPRVAVRTADIFRALVSKSNDPMPCHLPRFADASDLIGWLADQRNDLEAPALVQEPRIGAALGALRDAPDCLLARMSGSGATCVGLYGSDEAAQEAVRRIEVRWPEWWVRPVSLGDMTDRSMPVVS